jgi:glycosyltransferase involved in cell wall biosynthesis
MRIMTAMYTLRRGGAYDRFIMMLEAFLERGCEVHCLSLTPIHIKNPLYHNHILAFPFKMANHLVARFIVILCFPMYSLIVGWREKINLYVAFSSLYALILAAPKWMLKRPMVTMIRGNSSFGLKMRNSPKYLVWLNKVVEHLGLSSSDRIIAVNMAIREDIMKVIGTRRNIEVGILYNSVPSIENSAAEDLPQIKTRFGIPKDAKVLVTAGILNRGKNIEILIKCLPKIGIENVFILVVGDGSAKSDFHYREALKKLAIELDISERVIFTGWLEKGELWKIFHAADLFILSSLSEGMPNVLLEALGLDLPCLGSKISGIEDILEHEELMFDPRNDAAIADKVRQFFSDDHHSKDIIQLCRERKKSFVFDWKERVFQMVTQRPFHRGEACQSR